MIYIAFHINAWVWSSVFHARDTSVTEKLDYFSADACVLAGAYVTATRCYKLEYAISDDSVGQTLCLAQKSTKHYSDKCRIEFFVPTESICIAHY